MAIKSPKIWTSFEDQLTLLQQRGMIVEDKDKALHYLSKLGYYRLSGYFYPFRQFDGSGRRADCFAEATYFNDVLALYMFDKALRVLAMDALERIEVAVKVEVAYLLGKHHALAHEDPTFFQKDSVNFQHAKWLSNYQKLLNREKQKNDVKSERQSSFVQHHMHHYDGALPIWVGCEVWDFGTLSNLFRGLEFKYSDQIAKKYGIHSGKALSSFLYTFNTVRNISAHHGRLWNRGIVGRASLAAIKGPQWKRLNNEQAFTAFCLMQWMMQNICPNSEWKIRVKDTIKQFPIVRGDAINEVNLQRFGIPDGMDLERWQLWKR